MNYSVEGAVKLCAKCGRFMPIGEDRNLLPHKKFASQDWCVGEIYLSNSAFFPMGYYTEEEVAELKSHWANNSQAIRIIKNSEGGQQWIRKLRNRVTEWRRWKL